MTQRLITPQELLQAGTGIDWNTIAESATGSSPVQAIEQSNVIDRASSWVANYCVQRLDATTDTEQSILGGAYTKCWVDQNAWLWYRTDFFPILSISVFQWAIASAGVANPAFNNLNVNNLLTFGEFNRVNRVADLSQDWSWLKRGPGLLNIVYVNGYPNMVSTAGFTAGAAKTIIVDSTLGLTNQAGQIGNVLTIFDGANTETIQVQSVTDGTHFVAVNVANAHNTAGVGISAIPPDVKEAAILACIHFARIRGTEAFEMGGADSSSGVSTKTVSTGDALAQAEYLLQPYKRIL